MRVDGGSSGAGLPDPTERGRPPAGAYPPAVPATYAYPRVTLPRLLDDAAIDFPHTTAIEFAGARLSYRELVDQADRFATALGGLGVQRGDRVGLLLPNGPQHVAGLFGIWRAGATAVVLDPRTSLPVSTGTLEDTDCRVVLCLPESAVGIGGHGPGAPPVEVVAAAPADRLPLRTRLRRPASAGRSLSAPRARRHGVHRFDDLVTRSAPAAGEPSADPDDVAVLLAAGPDGALLAMLTHANLVAGAFQARLWVPDMQAGGETVLSGLPFSSGAGLTVGLLAGVLAAATLTIPLGAAPTDVAGAVPRLRPSLLVAGADVLSAVVDSGPQDVSSVRITLAPGRPVPPEIARDVEAGTQGRVCSVYGPAEACGLTHANPVYGRAKEGTVGLAVPDTAALLVDPAKPDRPARPGVPGLLAVAGPQVMAGYWNHAEDTAAALRGPWLLTGDLARIDDEGYVTLLGPAGASGGPGTIPS